MRYKKPKWKDAPEWANFRAQDANGYWYWYEKKPVIDADSMEWENVSGSRTTRAETLAEPTWDNSMSKRKSKQCNCK